MEALSPCHHAIRRACALLVLLSLAVGIACATNPIRRRRLGGTATPIPLSIPGLKVWLKADSLSLADGTGVQTWLDSSGSGNTASQATGGNQPVFKVGILNGKPVLRFTAANSSYMTTANFSTPLAQPNTILCVFSCTSNAVSRDVYDGISGARNNLNVNTGPRANLFAGGGNPAGTIAIGASPFIHSAVFNGAASNSWVNGAADIVNGNPGTGSMGGLIIGDNFTLSANFLQGDMAEILIYNANLTTVDRRRLEAYLGSKYGITVV